MVCIDMHKQRTNILLDAETLKEAQELGLNVSKTCENCLKRIINTLKQSYSEITLNDGGDLCRGGLAWFGRQTHNLENKRGKRP